MALPELGAFGDLTAVADLPTPAFLLDEGAAEHNIAHTIELLGGAERWRAHVKTARTSWTIDRLLAAGVTRFKASSIAELAVLLERGAPDALLAYPAVGPMQAAAAALATQYPQARISALVDNAAALAGWRGGLGAFVDIDTGMHRTGVAVEDQAGLLELVARLVGQGIELHGLHAYDGHLADAGADERASEVSHRMRQLAALASAVEAAGQPVPELSVGSSHTFLDSCRAVVDDRCPLITVGVGTAVYNDARSLARYAKAPGTAGYRRAGAVLTRVVSRGAGRATVDAGLTAVQVDAGRPHAQVLGHAGVLVGAPSQEHLVLTGEVPPLAVGELLLLLPRHVDTALAQFDVLYRIAADGRVVREDVIGRRHAESIYSSLD